MTDETDAQDEIVVAVEGDGATTATEQQVEKKATDPGEDLKAQFAELQAKSEAERVAREDAERRATAAQAEAHAARTAAQEARTEATESQADTIASGLAAAQSEADAATSAYAAAMEAGNFVEAAKAQRRIANAEAKIVRLDEAKADIETRKVRGDIAREPLRPPTAPERATDLVETYIAGRSAPTVQWLRTHKEWITDPDKNQFLTEAHFNAVRSKKAVDTPEYFEHIETYIGLRQPVTKTNGAAANGQQRATRRSAPVAPVGQGSGGGTSGGGPEVRLSKTEVNAANDGTHVWGEHDLKAGRIKDKGKIGEPIGTQEFARRKYQMMKDGAYGSQYTE